MGRAAHEADCSRRRLHEDLIGLIAVLPVATRALLPIGKTEIAPGNDANLRDLVPMPSTENMLTLLAPLPKADPVFVALRADVALSDRQDSPRVVLCNDNAAAAAPDQANTLQVGVGAGTSTSTS